MRPGLGALAGFSHWPTAKRFSPLLGKVPTGFPEWPAGLSGGFRLFKDMTPRREAAHSVVHSHS